MSECQFHNNCGGYCETQEEIENNLCEDCLQAERERDEEDARNQERHAALQKIAVLCGVENGTPDDVVSAVHAVAAAARREALIESESKCQEIACRRKTSALTAAMCADEIRALRDQPEAAQSLDADQLAGALGYSDADMSDARQWVHEAYYHPERPLEMVAQGELPELPTDVIAWVYPRAYGNAVGFTKPAGPQEPDDTDEWYCYPLFSDDQMHAYARAAIATAMQQHQAERLKIQYWKGIAASKFGDGRTVQQIEADARDAIAQAAPAQGLVEARAENIDTLRRA